MIKILAVVCILLSVSQLLIWLKIAYLQGMCETMIETIKAIEREDEENEVD